MQEDWIGFKGGDANLTRYVGNAPTLFIDPAGEEVLDPFDGVDGLEQRDGYKRHYVPMGRGADEFGNPGTFYRVMYYT